jgi:DNA-binding response OmpR family regulator
LRIADLQLCASTREVTLEQQQLKLTNMGFTILEKLMQHSPGIVARADLEFYLWGDEPPGSDALRTHIAVLRAAIDPPGLAPILLTHRGIGYQLLSSRRLSP